MKVTCFRCGQKRKAIHSKAKIIWLEHSMRKIIMHKNEQNKWECASGFGCAK